MSSARARRTGSVVPRSVSAAICSAAAHPSLRSCRCLSSSAPTSTPKFASRSRLSARERARSRSRISHSSPYPQPVQPHRRIAAAREHQLGGLGGPVLDEIGHVSGDRGRSDMEVVDDDRRPVGQLRGIVGDRRGDVSRYDALHREQAGGVGAGSRRHGPQSLDEAGPETDRVSVSPIAGQPGSKARRPGRRPARQQHALARASRRHNDGQPRPAPSVSRSSSTDLLTSATGSVVGRNFASANRGSRVMTCSAVAASPPPTPSQSPPLPAQCNCGWSLPGSG